MVFRNLDPMWNIHDTCKKGNLEKSDLKAVVGPAAQFKDARLVVEGEVGDVDGARRAKLGGRRPKHAAVVVHHRLAVHVAPGVVVRAETHTHTQTCAQSKRCAERHRDTDTTLE